MSEIDVAAWTGRQEQSSDHFSLNLLKRIAATFGQPVPAAGQALPPLWHWCFFQDPLPEAGLGADGHPARGGFLPPADNRNRMWAGGRIEFFHELIAGEAAQRVSTILKVEEKRGGSGALLFVTVRHEYFQAGPGGQERRLALREEQDIVYREATPPKPGSGQPLPEAQWQESISPTPVLLFRYSAVTFNGHRIHYDYPYVTETEGYPGLVVHGPMIATFNLQAFLRAHPETRVHGFTYRGLRPLIAPKTFQVGGSISAPGVADTWAGNADGLAQSGQVFFE